MANRKLDHAKVAEYMGHIRNGQWRMTAVTTRNPMVNIFSHRIDDRLYIVFRYNSGQLGLIWLSVPRKEDRIEISSTKP